MSMPGHHEIESSGVPLTSNAAYELTAPLEENLYDYDFTDGCASEEHCSETSSST